MTLVGPDVNRRSIPRRRVPVIMSVVWRPVRRIVIRPSIFCRRSPSGRATKRKTANRSISGITTGAVRYPRVKPTNTKNRAKRVEIISTVSESIAEVRVAAALGLPSRRFSATRSRHTNTRYNYRRETAKKITTNERLIVRTLIVCLFDERNFDPKNT